MSSFFTMLPHLVAASNLAATVFLVLGFLAIRRGDRALHQRRMVAAFTASALFLVFYLMRATLTPASRFPDAGWVRSVYRFILFTHMPTAAVVPVLALRLLFLAKKERFDQHRRLARWTWPLWMYVSVTGVLVYLFNVHIAPHYR